MISVRKLLISLSVLILLLFFVLTCFNPFFSFGVFIPIFFWFIYFILLNNNRESFVSFFNNGKYCLNHCLVYGIDNIVKRLTLKNKQNLSDNPLILDKNLLLYNIDFDYFLMCKHPDYDMYKVNCVHKIQNNLDAVYLIGKDKHTKIPYLLRCPPKYFRKSIMECIKWNLNIDSKEKLMEV